MCANQARSPLEDALTVLAVSTLVASCCLSQQSDCDLLCDCFRVRKALGAVSWIPYILARCGHTHHHHPLAAACFAGVQPVVGFVSVTQPGIRKADVQHNFLAESATEWLRLLNTRQLRDLDSLVAEDATCHVCLGLLLGLDDKARPVQLFRGCTASCTSQLSCLAEPTECSSADPLGGGCTRWCCTSSS